MMIKIALGIYTFICCYLIFFHSIHDGIKGITSFAQQKKALLITSPDYPVSVIQGNLNSAILSNFLLFSAASFINMISIAAARITSIKREFRHDVTRLMNGDSDAQSRSFGMCRTVLFYDKETKAQINQKKQMSTNTFQPTVFNDFLLTTVIIDCITR